MCIRDRPTLVINGGLNNRFGVISSDGQRIAFLSSDAELVEDDTNAAVDAFLWDRSTGQTRRLTSGADLSSTFVAIDGQGDAVAITTPATNLFDVADTNGFFDVLVWRETAVVEPECDPTESGVLASTSGVSVNLQGSTACFGTGLFNYGATDNAGIRIPAAGSRPELRLIPNNDQGLPDNDLIFFTYPSVGSELLYATSFVAADTGHTVQMTFRTGNPNAFQLYELIVYEPGGVSRQRVAYREQDTLWTFSPESIDNVLNLTAEVFFDVDDDNNLSVDERRSAGISTVLFRCGNQDGLAGNQDTDNNGIALYAPLEPGFYQLAVSIPSFLRFSSPAFDSTGNQLNTIRSVVTEPTGAIGYSSCTDFTGSVSAFAPIGLVSQ